MKQRSRTPDAEIRFLFNKEDTIFYPEFHYPPDEVETPRISNPQWNYMAIHIPGHPEKRIKRIPPVPWYEPRRFSQETRALHRL